MELLIACSKNDLSAGRILEAAQKRFNASLVFYSDIKEVPEADFFILRDPYTSGDYSAVFREILEKSKGNVLDYKAYSKYPDYEDKLFQHRFFSGFGMPRFWERPVEFPVIAKKRISSRGKGLYILRTVVEAGSFFKGREENDYVFVEPLDVVRDIRVFVLGGKVICPVERKVRFKERGSYQGIGVKVSCSIEISKEMEEKSLAIAEKIGADFCGLDFVVDRKEKEYFIECNISPQFKSSEKVLSLDIAEMLVDFVERKSRNGI